MFAGKSTALLQRLETYFKIGKSILAIGHTFDNRYSSENKIITHDGKELKCIKTKQLI